MQTGQNGLVIRLGGVMGDTVERIAQTGKTIRLANRIGIVFRAQSQRNLEMGLYAPFILRVESQSVQSQWLGWPRGIGLLICVNGARKKAS